ncbi:DUF1491 family protein [Chelatococcus sp. SYSU_G07232]|uniref:DUF1491 family protein n=1 Tax=Chelatococcus albus TaxID=3047466 RepID=A0ABT7AI25_9HYPH|nr:DUF1491 family protein [Chelatococcus sp. SYSU_G07232]MDJ1159051.1 DUF1491 family protein [Chelatococcus sp. SYSU_G07232]
MRLRTDIWVSAYLRRCAVGGAYAVLRRRGAAEAGTVFVKVDRLDGTAALYGPAPQSFYEERAEERRFVAVDLGAEATPLAAEERLRREISFDPDVWVVEVEDRVGRHFLEVAAD